MSTPIDPANMPSRAVVEFTCSGTAVGKMRNELDVKMVTPMQESFAMATDEGAFHGVMQRRRHLWRCLSGRSRAV
ncbi:MAG: hypothetical protein Q9M48_08230 [Rhodobacterales bacterium]|nr:hypothetical protein [Rhodobacterales bacterium]